MTEGPAASKDIQDALAAIERLVHRHSLLTPEQGTQAARIITGDESFQFPPPAAPSASTSTPQTDTPPA